MDHRAPSQPMYACRRRLRRLLNTPSTGRPVISCSIAVVKPRASALARCVKSWRSARGRARAPRQAATSAAGALTLASSARVGATRRSSTLSLLLCGVQRHRRPGGLPLLTQSHPRGVDVVIHCGLEVLVTRSDLEALGGPPVISQNR